MKSRFSLFILFFLWFVVGSSAQEVKRVDICVYGGTASGVIAANAAAKMGKRVLLVEPGKYLGGMTTGGLGFTDIGNKVAVTGLARLFYRRVGEAYGKAEQWTFPPSVATAVIGRFVKESTMEVLYTHRIIGAKVKSRRIVNITLEDAVKPKQEPVVTVEAKEFIDCSYEGDLMARAGVSYFIGRESNREYGESLNGVYLSKNHQFPDGVDPYRVEGDPQSGLCWGISPAKMREAGRGDRLIQAYNFRLCLTDKPENRIPFVRPSDYDSTHYELLARAIRKMGTNIDSYLLINWGRMPDNKYDVNNRGPLSTDMIGMNYDYPEGSYATREKIWQAHVSYTKGLLYFLTHDSRIPAELQQKVATLGWAKDEFVDNNHFPTQLYVREARRLHGEYIMTEKNCLGREVVSDSIGHAAYGMDSHNCERIVVDGMVKNEGNVEVGNFPPYPIAYRSLTPLRRECCNLLVPVCVSATHIAYGSIRMEPVFMVLGQSAAMAASMAIDHQCAVQDIDVRALQQQLKEDPLLDATSPSGRP